MAILAALLEGLVLGPSIAAPIGPIGLLCIRRTLEDGHATGLASGLGAATADALYRLVAGVFAGSALWWLVLTAGVSLARRRVTPSMITAVNRASGLALAGFGAAALFGAL